MGLTWTPWVIAPILALVAAWGAAIILLRTAPDRSLNRRLAFVLFLEGIWLGGGVFFTIEDPVIFLAIAAVAVGAMAALPFQYLSFLGVSLATPLVAPFRPRIAFALLALASATAGLWVLLFPATFLGDLYSPEWATWNFQFRPAGARIALVHGVASLFGLVAAAAAFLKAKPGTDARSRAKWFMIAFGVRDLFNAVTWTLYPLLRPIPFWGDFVANQGPGIVNVLYVGLMSYGVLRAQLFDIDLKLKFALRQGTVGAVFAGAFFTGSELLERVVPVEGTILGLIVAGSIVLALRPVQRFAETFAGRVMRGVQDTPSYVEGRKHEVYRATLEGTLEDGAITDRERAVLDRLREQLGISREEAELVEREMVLAAG
jgi:hypothetical protein